MTQNATPPTPASEADSGTWEVVVVGAGPGGLKCGAYLAANGKRVLVLEANQVVGGSTQVFRRAGNKFEFDVGIAEQHAVTFCAGLACEGFKPFAAIYSTFLQRAYDQEIGRASCRERVCQYV